MLNPVVLIIAALVAAAVALKKLIGLSSEHEKLARETAESMGVTVSQAKAMVKEAQNTASSFGNTLIVAKDVLTVQQAITEELGNSGMISSEVAGTVASIGTAFGYGAKAAGEMQAQFQALGMEQGAAADLQRELAADTLKAGANTGKVIADINKNAKTTSKFFKGDVKALTKAAIQANKMGMSLDSMAKTADTLLNFEENIAAQFEFMALTGKDINLDKARQLAFDGDLVGTSKEILKNAGSLTEFTRMGHIEQQKFAEMAGMSVDEITKSLAISEQLPNATKEQLKFMQEQNYTLQDIQSMDADRLQSMMEQDQANKKLESGMANMKAQLGQALLPLAEALMQVFSSLTPILKVIGGIFKMLGAFVKGIVSPVMILFNIFTSIGDAVADILDYFGFLDPIITGLSFTFDVIKNTLMIAGALLGTVFLPTLISVAAGAISAAVGFLASAIGAIFSTFSMIPFGIGIPLALLAIGGLFTLFSKAKSAGDVGIDPNGGPVVASPREGALFQGTKNDGVSMSPSHGTPNGTNNTDNNTDNQSMPSAAAIGMAVANALKGIKFNTPPVQIGNEIITSIAAESDRQRTYKK